LDICWIFGYLDICFGNGAKRISRNSYIGFGKSYLIPETTNFDIGEGIVNTKAIMKWKKCKDNVLSQIDRCIKQVILADDAGAKRIGSKC